MFYLHFELFHIFRNTFHIFFESFHLFHIFFLKCFDTFHIFFESFYLFHIFFKSFDLFHIFLDTFHIFLKTFNILIKFFMFYCNAIIYKYPFLEIKFIINLKINIIANIRNKFLILLHLIKPIFS